MKKWYVITGILALLLVISMSTCSSNSAEVDTIKAELADAKTELTDAKTELDKLQGDYEKLQQEYSTLQATKEMVFGKGIRLFNIQWKKGYWGILEGKVQNINDKPMEKIEIIVVSYNPDGSLRDFYSTRSIDLFPQEIAEWSIGGIFLEHGSLYETEIEEILAIYAFGNR